MSEFSIVNPGTQHALAQKCAEALLKTNGTAGQFGLRLTREEALALVKARDDALRGYGRIELGTGILDRIALAFCDSPHMHGDSYAETLAALVDLFYQVKAETLDRMPDELVLARMKEAFDGKCEGSLKLLAGRMDELCYNVRVYGSETAPEPEEDGHLHGHGCGCEEDDEEYERAIFDGEEDENWRTLKF